MLESCRRPDLVTEITLQPVRRHGVDAAILFSDIVVPLAAAGVDLDIVAGTGPVVAEPIRTAADVDRLRPIDRRPTSSFVDEAVRLLVAGARRDPADRLRRRAVHAGQLPDRGRPVADVPEDQGDDVRRTRSSGTRCCSRLADITLTFLRVQIDAGVSAVQLFDSWAGALSEADYRRYVLPHSAKVLAGLADAGVPRIHFGVGTAVLLEAMGEAGADVVGVDWRTPLDRGHDCDRPGPGGAGQPGPGAAVRAAGRSSSARPAGCSSEGRAAPGHVFNLGHGVMPETDPDVLTRLVELIHSVRPGTSALERGPG